MRFAALVQKFEKNQQAIAKLNRQIEEAVGTFIEKKNALEAANEEMKAQMQGVSNANDAVDSTKVHE